MDAADEDVAQKQWFIADTEFHRTRRPTPDCKRCAPQEDVEAKCQHQDHDDRTARETPKRHPFNAKPQTEHDDRSKRNS